MITRENKLFRLSWLKSNLFRATSTETAYNARMLENETGQDMFDRYAMTIDERPFFDEHIAQALLALLHHFRRIVPDCQPITTEGDACGLTFAARVSRDEDEFYSHAEPARRRTERHRNIALLYTRRMVFVDSRQ